MQPIECISAQSEGVARRAEMNLATNPKDDGVQLPSGVSPAISAVNRLIEQVAPYDSTVLILGESGTGKEIAARADPRREPAPPAPVRRRQLRRHSRRAARERAVRPREGLLHRRHHHPQGTIRNRRGRHAVPRRDRRHEPADAGEIAARPAGARVRTRRQQRVERVRRAHHRRHASQPRRIHRARQLPRRPVLPPQRIPHRDADAQRRASTTCRCSSTISCRWPPRAAVRACSCCPRPSMRSPRIRGPATSASSRISSSASPSCVPSARWASAICRRVIAPRTGPLRKSRSRRPLEIPQLLASMSGDAEIEEDEVLPTSHVARRAGRHHAPARAGRRSARAPHGHRTQSHQPGAAALRRHGRACGAVAVASPYYFGGETAQARHGPGAPSTPEFRRRARNCAPATLPFSATDS